MLVVVVEREHEPLVRDTCIRRTPPLRICYWPSPHLSIQKIQTNRLIRSKFQRVSDQRVLPALLSNLNGFNLTILSIEEMKEVWRWNQSVFDQCIGRYSNKQKRHEKRVVPFFGSDSNIFSRKKKEWMVKGWWRRRRDHHAPLRSRP